MTHINGKICIALATALSLSIAMANESKAVEECAKDEQNCWTCGNTCVARLDASGKLSVQGSGAMYNYGRIDEDLDNLYHGWITNAPWNTQIENIKSIDIGEGITSVGTFAFANVNKAKTLSIAGSVERIEEGGFDRCHELTTVDFAQDSKLKYIGRSAFYWDENLNKIEIPESVESINSSFGGTTALREIILPDSAVNLYDIFLNFNNVPFDSKNITLKCNGNLEKCKKNLQKAGLLNSFADIIPACGNEQALLNHKCVECSSIDNVFWDGHCLSEYPFAKKRWTPAEAAQWLHDGNDNFVILTFKK